MVYNIRCMLVFCSFLVMTIYLMLASFEDSKSCEVTRLKHLIGLVPAGIMLMIYIKDRSLFDLGILALFMLLCLLIGAKGVYGMADGFVFANLIMLFGGMSGIVGIGLVILIMILACFSGMIEQLLQKMMTGSRFNRRKHIAFIPHILTGYMSVIIALIIWL